MGQIHVIHENPAWLPPLAEALDRRGLPWTDWFLDAGTFDLAAPPPEGVFYNRMSASSHTRDHRYAAELTAGVPAWLTRWGRPAHKFTVVDGIDPALRARLEAFMERAGVDVAGIEFIAGPDGAPLVYDVNTNTNYNPEAEVRAGIAGTARCGMGALAEHLATLLTQAQRRAA